LQKWGKEEWGTSDGEPAVRGKKTARYLPKKAWQKLSASEKEDTNQKKLQGSARGKQYVRNTRAAKKRRSQIHS
jgi:hypothetical protein